MEMIASAQQKMDFMNLMVAELQNQNPLEPLDNQQMAAQLAQFTQLELTEGMNQGIAAMNESVNKLNTSFQGAMLVAEFDYAKSLLGKDVSFYSADYAQQVTGQVNKVSIDQTNGRAMLEVNGKVRQPNGDLGDDVSFTVDVYALSEILK